MSWSKYVEINELGIKQLEMVKLHLKKSMNKWDKIKLEIKMEIK